MGPVQWGRESRFSLHRAPNRSSERAEYARGIYPPGSRGEFFRFHVHHTMKPYKRDWKKGLFEKRREDAQDRLCRAGSLAAIPYRAKQQKCPAPAFEQECGHFCWEKQGVPLPIIYHALSSEFDGVCRMKKLLSRRLLLGMTMQAAVIPFSAGSGSHWGSIRSIFGRCGKRCCC